MDLGNAVVWQLKSDWCDMLRAAKWNTRAWTFPGGILAHTRLICTPSTVYCLYSSGASFGTPFARSKDRVAPLDEAKLLRGEEKLVSDYMPLGRTHERLGLGRDEIRSRCQVVPAAEPSVGPGFLRTAKTGTAVPGPGLFCARRKADRNPQPLSTAIRSISSCAVPAGLACRPQEPTFEPLSTLSRT